MSKPARQKFINEKRWVAGWFSWQEGFGAFSYPRSQLSAVIRYIEKQQKHHARKSFRDEYVERLEKFNVNYDRRYIFKIGDERIEPYAAPAGLNVLRRWQLQRGRS